ncbi:MAG: methylated-DNA-protein-cysteine methyltransferase-like protein [Planctomycetota bacterium]|jgi:methylated-DNA-protein-cysteine methyltransferase-like protein
MVQPVNSPNEANQSHQRILATVDSIPVGRVASYGQVADEAGLPGRARLVGKLMRELPKGSEIPWHRVINAAGQSSLDPTSPSGAEQLRLLRTEGVDISTTGRVDLRRFRWDPS